MLPVKVFFGLLLAAIVCGAYYFLRNRKELFSGRGSDPATDSPAAGNLRMWMVILILVHAGAILTIMIVEL